MSCWNVASTVAASIESILGQTLEDFRFIIYDDASTDGTPDVLKSYHDPRIDLRLLPRNRGLSCNLHEAVAEAATPFIARIDADDIALPHRLAEQVAFMEAHPDIGVLGTNVFFFCEDGIDVLGRQPAKHDDIAIALFFDFTIIHPTVMLRTSILSANGLNYNPRFRYSQDFDLWSRMISDHKFANLQKPLVRVREHPGKISRAKRGKQQRFTTLIRARQIRRLLPDATADEIKIFSAAARGDIPENARGLKQLEGILLRLIGGNETRRIYVDQAFNTAASALLKETCRQMLRSGKIVGAGFLTSPLRKYSGAETTRSKIKFLGLCGLAALKGLRKA